MNIVFEKVDKGYQIWAQRDDQETPFLVMDITEDQYDDAVALCQQYEDVQIATVGGEDGQTDLHS